MSTTINPSTNPTACRRPEPRDLARADSRMSVRPGSFPTVGAPERQVSVSALALLFTAAVFCPPPSCLAAQWPSSDGERAPARTAADVSRILAMAPANAFAVGYTSDTAGLFQNPLLAAALREQPDAREVLGVLRQLVDGPAVVAMAGLPVNPLSWRFTIATRTGKSPLEFFASLRDDLVGTWSRAGVPGTLQFWDDGRVGHLSVIGPWTINLDIAVRDGIVLASSAPGDAEAWLDADPSGNRWIDGEDFDRVQQNLPGPITSLAYVNLRQLVPLAAGPLNKSLPNLFRALALDDIEFVAHVTSDGARLARVTPDGAVTPATTNRRSTKPTADLRKASIATGDAQSVDPQGVERLVVGLRKMEPGVWQLLASEPRELSLARYFPANTSVFESGSMETAASMADDVLAVVGTIGQDIVDEYTQERRELQREIGFDPHGEFLRNFVDEWALGVRGMPPQEPLLAVRMAKAATFQTHLQKLRSAFQLRIIPKAHRGIAIQRAERDLGSFHFAVLDDVLLVSAKASTLRGAIDAYSDSVGLSETVSFQSAVNKLPEETSKLVFLDLREILSELTIDDDIQQFPELAKLLQARTALAISVTRDESTIAVDFATNAAPDGFGAGLMIASVVMPSLSRARELSKRLVSASNVKGIITGCKIFANDHDNQWPRSLQELVPTLKALAADGLFGDANAMAGMLSDPYHPGDPDGKNFYLYRYLPNAEALENQASVVVASEPVLRQGGANFGFLDGHVEWIDGPRAAELLRLMRRGGS